MPSRPFVGEVADEFDNDVAQMRRIYGVLFEIETLKLRLSRGRNPIWANPLVRRNLPDGQDNHRGERYVGTLTRAKSKDSAGRVQVDVEIPPAPTEEQLSGKEADWKPRPKLQRVYDKNPVVYEQIRYLTEMARKARFQRRADTEPLPPGFIVNHTVHEARTPEDKRPAILVGFHWLEVGGAEKLAFDCVEWALEAGLRVIVVASEQSHQRLAGKLPSHPDVEFLRLDLYLPHALWPAYIPKLVLAENIRIIHIHHCRPLYGSLPRLRTVTPWVTVLDSTHIVEHVGGGFPRIAGKWTNFVDLHHVISGELVSYFRDAHGVEKNVRLGRMLDGREQDISLPDLNMKAGRRELRVAFVGRLTYQKRPITVIEIIRSLRDWAREQGIAFHACFVGEGPFAEAVEGLLDRYDLRDVVEMHAAGVDVPALLSRSDVLLLPSNNEGLALVCYEAIENGCIPVSTDVGSQNEIVPPDLLLPLSPFKSVSTARAIVDRLWRDGPFLARQQKALHDAWRRLAGDPTAKDVVMPVYQAALTAEEDREAAPKVRTAAVVVTYNRSDKLVRVLDALDRQTEVPDLIFVVDNASTDDTEELVTRLAAERPNLRHVRLPENLGGAGGFNAGIKEAYASGAKYLWVSDDDAYPEPDAIEKLREAIVSFETENLSRPSFACSRVEWIDGSMCEMNTPQPVWDWPRYMTSQQGRALVASCSFVSVLIPRWAVRANGLPIADYFIWFDDAEYTLRLSRSYPGVFVPESRVVHDTPENKGVNYGLVSDKTIWKFRYGARNEASYHFRERGFVGLAGFLVRARSQMRGGNVRKPLRKEVYKAILSGYRFQPKIEQV